MLLHCSSSSTPRHYTQLLPPNIKYKKKSTGRNRFKKLYYWNSGKQAKKRGGGSEKHKMILEGHSCYEFQMDEFAEKLLQLLETRCREQTTAKESNTFRVTQFPFSQTRQAGAEHSPISD